MIRWLGLALYSAASFAATSDFQWNGSLPPGQTLEVKGINGAVRVVEAASPGIAVKATRTARRDDPNAVRIEVVPHAGGITICAVYPSPDRSKPNECKPGEAGRTAVKENDVEVAFEVELPAGLHLVAKTVNGAVEARRISGDVKAQTVNGRVVVEAKGNVEARTVNGGITLNLAEGSNAALSASVVNGRIESELPLTVKHKVSRRVVNATIGHGGKELKLQTVNGSIRIRRSS
ncbi:MAG: DUF4097 family beta strand repeat-containing protein [Bryobacteraceae bacterium]